MKKIIIGILALTSVLTFANESYELHKIDVLSIEETSFGAKVRIGFYTNCDSTLLPSCIGNFDKFEKNVTCKIKDGLLEANVEITHKYGLGGSLVYKTQNEKIRMDRLCQGRTPDRLIVNSQQIL